MQNKFFCWWYWKFQHKLFSFVKTKCLSKYFSKVNCFVPLDFMISKSITWKVVDFLFLDLFILFFSLISQSELVICECFLKWKNDVKRKRKWTIHNDLVMATVCKIIHRMKSQWNVWRHEDENINQINKAYNWAFLHAIYSI